VKEFFKNLPFNTSKVYGVIPIIDSNCTLYVPALNEKEADANKAILYPYFNPVNEVDPEPQAA